MSIPPAFDGLSLSAAIPRVKDCLVYGGGVPLVVEKLTDASSGTDAMRRL
jgi:hypothetical protein